MEAASGIIIIIGFFAFLMFFKKSIRRVARYTDDIVATNISEGQSELIERAQEAYEDIIATCGEDYLTPQEMYDKIHHKRRRNQAKTTA